MNFTLFQQFAEKSNKFLFQFSPDTHQFDYLSQGTGNVLGINDRELLENPEVALQIIPDNEREAISGRFRDLLAGLPVSITVRVKAAEKKLKFISVDALLVTDPESNKPVIAGMAEDVTIEAEYEAYLLEYAHRKDSVLAIVAHDLKAPLANIQAAAALLQKEKTSQRGSAVQTLFKIIDQSCSNCIDLITDVLHDEHIKSPTIKVKKDRIDVLELTEFVLTSYRTLNNLGHHFEVICSEEQLYAELDELKFTQILNNLIVNSIKFTPGGGTVSITLKRAGNELHIIHADTGIGIGADVLPNIFDRYNKGARPGLRGEASSGVGLSIVRQLVEVQGGTIRASSEEGVGTTFYLTFPLK